MSKEDNDDYQRGYEQAKAEYELKMRPPLFEACRDFCRENWRKPEQALRDGIAKIQADYGQTLAKADVDLCLAQQRRKRLEAQRSEIRSRTGDITEYQVVQ